MYILTETQLVVTIAEGAQIGLVKLREQVLADIAKDGGMDEEEKDIEDEPVLKQRIRKIVSVAISSFPIHFHTSI